MAKRKHTQREQLRLANPIAALDEQNEDVLSWIRQYQKETASAEIAGRKLLTKKQLDEIEAAVMQCGRDSIRSADSRLPRNAGELVRNELPHLLGNVSQLARHTPPLKKDVIQKIKQIDLALKDARRIRALLARIVRTAPYDFKLNEFCESCQVQTFSLAHHLNLMRAKLSAPMTKGRRRDPWMSLLLTQLAVWWRRQGWQPTSSQLGAYMTVAGLVHTYHHGRTSVARIPHSAVLHAWKIADNILAMDSKLNEVRRSLANQSRTRDHIEQLD